MTPPLEIVIEGARARKSWSSATRGIGMTHDELVTNLGTIAHSGSAEFLKAAIAKKEEKSDLSLIGQFGVGFYSAFMIAEKVRVRTRSYAEDSGWEWESDGTGSFTVTPVEESLPRGTEVTLVSEGRLPRRFASDWRIKDIVKRYSSFVPYPIRLGSGGEVINDQKPIWVEPKSQVTEEQYTRFYQHLTHHPDEKPLWHLHMAADSPIQFRAIVYCPPTNLENLGFARLEHGLNLCAKRVLVQSDCRELLPEYLRFLRGLVDSEDLPLNVSRETLQDNSVIRKIRTSIVKGVLDRLDRLAQDDARAVPEVLRPVRPGLEGRADRRSAPINERIAKLLRFASSRSDDPQGAASRSTRISRRCRSSQTQIYYLAGTDFASIAKSPNLEIFRRKGIEVLYLTDPIDEFALKSLASYREKKLTSIDSADIEIPEAGTTGEKAGESTISARRRRAASPKCSSSSAKRSGPRVSEVRESKRLTDSPCCLVNVEGGMSTQMQRLLKMANKEFTESARILEINPSAPLIRRLCHLSANDQHHDFIKHCGLQLWSDAMILDGVTPEPEDLVARVQSFMAEAAEKRSPLIL